MSAPGERMCTPTIVFDGIDFSGDKPKPIIHLEGEPLMRFGEGSHSNLNNSDVDEGDWEIRGSLIPSVVCPAAATAALLKALSADSGAVRYDR